MRGAPARAIQDLAGHADLRTTRRYMHLSPAALESAIRLLEHRAEGGSGEAAVRDIAKYCSRKWLSGGPDGSRTLKTRFH
jgi:hypothetical protein